MKSPQKPEQFHSHYSGIYSPGNQRQQDEQSLRSIGGSRISEEPLEMLIPISYSCEEIGMLIKSTVVQTQ